MGVLRQELRDVTTSAQDPHDLNGPFIRSVDDEVGTHRPEAQGLVGEVLPEVADLWQLRKSSHRGTQLSEHALGRGRIVCCDVVPDVAKIITGLR